jgi:catechol 2,3-dioxygenase-like lactoylglutathione lyase family enzyme
MSGYHHVAFACRDIDQTVKFYDDLLGFPLVHTEIQGKQEHFMRHIFFDLGDGSALAFFDLHSVGEPEDFRTDISTGMGLPLWVNHLAFRADAARIAEVRETMSAAGIEPEMDLDHDWCQSVYYKDPNGILIEFCEDTPGFTPDPQGARKLISEVPSG